MDWACHTPLFDRCYGGSMERSVRIFDLFILQDFFCACFFHLLLDPLAAFRFGSVRAGVALALNKLELAAG